MGIKKFIAKAKEKYEQNVDESIHREKVRKIEKKERKEDEEKQLQKQLKEFKAERKTFKEKGKLRVLKREVASERTKERIAKSPIGLFYDPYAPKKKVVVRKGKMPTAAAARATAKGFGGSVFGGLGDYGNSSGFQSSGPVAPEKPMQVLPMFEEPKKKKKGGGGLFDF